MNNPIFEQIFPTPIMLNNINREFTQEELNGVDRMRKDLYKNRGNNLSNNRYVLEEREFADLKLIILEHVETYIQSVYKPKYKVTPYITQSWLSYTERGEYHHQHNHPNSFVSGVLYINAKETEDLITFHKSEYEQITLETDEYNIFNCKTWFFNVKTGKIIMFPSKLSHHVANVTSNNTRISLGFNVFLSGRIGDNKMFNELFLK
jgi:uncharacterized protein (TIGR02466 family)